MIYDCLVIGSGPCGISAAIKLKEAGVKVALIEFSTPGGKVNIAPRVDNYPGYKSIPGPDLAVVFFNRFQNSGVEFIGDKVVSLVKENDLFIVKCENGEYQAKTVMVASGTKERKLGFENEDRLFAHGISYCAICDGHFFKDQTVAIIGGGNAALKEAIYLSPIVKKIYLIHRRKEFRGLNKLVDELVEMGNAEVLTPYTPKEILGKEKVTGLVIHNVETDEDKTLDVEGIFPLIGQIPNTQFIDIDGVLDEWKTIPVSRSMMSNCEGLFAGGDVLPRDIRQIYLAQHDGEVAAKNIIEYLNK